MRLTANSGLGRSVSRPDQLTTFTLEAYNSVTAYWHDKEKG